MISLFTLFSTGLSAIVCCLGGIGFAVWVAKKKEGTFKMFLLGFLSYTMFVLVVQQTVDGVLNATGLYDRLWLRVILVAVLTALTEVGGRALVYAIFMKDGMFLPNGLMLGAGYGWTEAVLSVGVTAVYLTALGAAAYRQPEILSQTLDAEDAQMLYEQLQNIQGGQMLLTCMNRMLTLTLQIAVSVILMTAFSRRNALPALEAVLLQGGNAALMELLSGLHGSAIAALGVLAVFTAISVWEAVRLAKYLQEQASEPSDGQVWNKRLSRRRL